MRGQCSLWLLFGALALVAKCDDAGDKEMPEMPDEEPENGNNGEEALSSQTTRALHAKMDADKDGKVSMAEVLVFAKIMRLHVAKKDIHTIVDEMDGDKDGKISLPEFLKDLEQQSEGEEDKAQAATEKELETAKFKAADEDGNGLLDTNELPGLFYPETHDGVLTLMAQATLKSKDLDGNGELTSKEFWQADSPDGSASEEEQSDFAYLDVDKSGTLSAQELKAWESSSYRTEESLKKLLELGDKDNDGMVTADELDSAREVIASSDAHYHMAEWAEHSEL